MDWSGDELKYLYFMEKSGISIHIYTIQLHCTNCPWACIREIRSSKASIYSEGEVYKCPLCEQATVKCKIERARPDDGGLVQTINGKIWSEQLTKDN